jgi:hypothetical protein
MIHLATSKEFLLFNKLLSFSIHNRYMQLKSQLKTFTSLMDLLVHQTTNNFKAAAEYISGTFF